MTKQKQKGFTLIEMLVVLSIMGVMAGLFIANYNGQSQVRNLKIAKSEFVTNARKVQSYILSARNVSTGSAESPAKFYSLSLGRKRSSYVISGYDSQTGVKRDIETVKLPQGVTIERIDVFAAGQTVGQTVSTAQVLYSAPYGKMYVLGRGDCGDVNSAECLLQLADRKVDVQFKNQKSGQVNSVSLYGVSGSVIAN